MRLYIGFDDTDNIDSPIGTGKLVRRFVYELPEECHIHGVVRHQLPKLKDIPFTSNNSSACAVIELGRELSREWLTEHAQQHLVDHCAPGSDPGLCIATEDEIGDDLVTFGQRVTGVRVTQREAFEAANGVELYGLGGTNDGIIGATAAVGLTKFGWCGRFIEYGKLRDLGEDIRVNDMTSQGIRLVSTDRNPLVPQQDDRLINAKWIRPSLWAGQPVLQVRNVEHGVWEPAHGKRKKKHNSSYFKKAGDPGTNG